MGAFDDGAGPPVGSARSLLWPQSLLLGGREGHSAPWDVGGLGPAPPYKLGALDHVRVRMTAQSCGSCFLGIHLLPSKEAFNRWLLQQQPELRTIKQSTPDPTMPYLRPRFGNPPV